MGRISEAWPALTALGVTCAAQTKTCTNQDLHLLNSKS